MDPQFSIPQQRSRTRTWIRRVIIAVFAIHIALAGWGFYRRIWQVLRIDLQVSSVMLTPGATVSYDVITTGEAQNRILLELVQGGTTETLVEQRARLSAVNMYDPRVFTYAQTISITANLLQHFAPGPATLRLTGFGGQRLLRTPAPRVREIAVQVVR